MEEKNAVAEMKIDNIKGAVEDCSQAIKLQDNDTSLYAHRSSTYKLAGEYEEALDDLSSAIN